MTQSSLLSNQTRAASKPSIKGKVASSNTSKYSENPSGIVVALTLSLSWQLAIVVLVPILGGHFLDSKMKTGAWFTLAGFLLAMILMVVVIRKMLGQLNEYMKPEVSETKSDDGEGVKK
jgi:F0F1-type ATP synthase assembly protein I